MITVYAVSLSDVDRGPDDFVGLVDVIDEWRDRAFPWDSETGHAPGITMRSRYHPDQGVFRLSVADSATHPTHLDTTTITLVLEKGVLTFDVRIVSTPANARVVPFTPPLVTPDMVQLVRDVLRAMPVRDAERPVVDAAVRVDTEMGGQEIGALVWAAGRRLPVVVEIDDPEKNTAPLLGAGPGPLVGLVHLVRLSGEAAMRGYAEMAGMPLAVPGMVAIHWAGNHEPEVVFRREIAAASEPRQRDRLVRLVTETAARSLASPRVPPPPREDDLIPDETDSDDATTDADDTLVAYVESLESEIADKDASLAAADRIIREQRVQLERRTGQVDQLVLQNVSLQTAMGTEVKIPSVASVAEAVRIAREKCEFLVFHPRAIESAASLHGPNPTALLTDLWRLNTVARAWIAGEVTGSSISIACSSVGLDWAAGISETARRKYEEDYLIDWNGRTVRAEGHVRRGRKENLYRIHVWFDEDTHQVVVAYIGRHLRDKSTN